MPSLHVLSVTYNRRQDVKRDHTTYLAFAEAFKSLLERRRRRKASAFDREIDGQGDKEHLLSMLLPDGKKRGLMRVNPATVIFTHLLRNDVKVKSCHLFSTQSAMMGTPLKFITCELQNLQPIPGIIDDFPSRSNPKG